MHNGLQTYIFIADNEKIEIKAMSKFEAKRRVKIKYGAGTNVKLIGVKK